MQTQSLLTQTPLFQGNPLPKRKLKEEFWVISRTKVPVFGAETPSQMLGEDHTNQLKANTLAFEEIPHLTLGEGDKGGEDSTKIWEPPTHKSFVIGQKRYEISNHLGNVTSVITDRKFGVPVSGTDPTINYYLADIVSATDYDPYGQALPGRVWNRTGYRFGFNGQEFDSELGEIWSAEFWEYDASLGRRWDIDPIDLPWQSPYVGLDNNPIFYSDPLGLAATGDGEGSPEQQKQQQKPTGPKEGSNLVKYNGWSKVSYGDVGKNKKQIVTFNVRGTYSTDYLTKNPSEQKDNPNDPIRNISDQYITELFERVNTLYKQYSSCDTEKDKDMGNSHDDDKNYIFEHIDFKKDKDLTIDEESTFGIAFMDHIKDIGDLDNSGKSKQGGAVRGNRNNQMIPIALTGDLEEDANSIVHELFHSAGLPHVDDPKEIIVEHYSKDEIQNNIMKTKPTKNDKRLVLKQKKELDQFVPHFEKDFPKDRPVWDKNYKKYKKR